MQLRYRFWQMVTGTSKIGPVAINALATYIAIAMISKCDAHALQLHSYDRMQDGYR